MPGQDPPIYYHVLASLRIDCIGGTVYGHRLPSEPALSKRYGVSRTTVRRAIATLIAEGVLESRHGSGTFIRPGSGRTRTIGLIFADSIMKSPRDPYAQQLINNLIRTFAQHGWTLRPAQSAEDMHEHLASERGSIVSACVAALFSTTFENVGLLTKMPVPLVLLDSELHPDVPCIVADNEPGMHLAVERAVELGHRRIVHLAGPDYALSGRERLVGFQHAMHRAGLELRDGDIRHGVFDIPSGYAAMGAWWTASCRPTAVVCANDLMALGAMNWLDDHGIRPGTDISVIGCDDLLFSELTRPGLATVALDFEAHAQAVLDAIIDVHRPGVRRTRMSLIERGSLQPVRSESV